jgi:hypothetical protein
MSPLLVIVVFYGLLALAMLLLRGDLTAWPPVVDRILAMVVSLGAVGWLLRGWSSRQPMADAAGGGVGGRARSMWLWWAGLVGLAAVVFLVALPPLSRVLARPLAVERTAPGRDSMGENLPPADGGTIPERDPAGAGAEAGLGAGAAAGTGAGLAESRLDRWQAAWRELVQSRPPWLVVLMVVVLGLTAGVLGWWWWRWRQRPAQTGAGGPPKPWHADASAPAYVREFCRLCEQAGQAPRPGDTWRELCTRLDAAIVDPSLLDPVAAYHYRVRYEGAATDRAVEREWARLIRAARKAAIFPPATEKVTAASEER